jgi:hypothetical protein
VTPAVIVPTRIWPYYGGLVGAGAFYNPFFWNSPGPWYGADVPLSTTGTDSYAPPDPFGTDGPTGSLRLRVEPATAEVFVDGYYAGVVDDFNGLFHHLNLGVGPHHLDVRASGYEPLGVEVYILAHHTAVYRGVLLRSHE